MKRKNASFFQTAKSLMPETCFISRVPCSEVQGTVNSNRSITLF